MVVGLKVESNEAAFYLISKHFGVPTVVEALVVDYS